MLDSVKTALREHRTTFLLTAVALLGLVYLFMRTAYGTRVDAYTAMRGDIVQTLVASGRVETPLRVDIGTQVTGTVASIPVAEGQTVKAGQLLIALEDSEAKASVAQAHAAVAQARMRLRQLQEVALPAAQQGLRQAQINLDNARRQHERTSGLAAKGFVGQSQLDDAQQKLDLAESQLRSAELQVATNSPKGSDVMMAKAALEQAEANLNMALAKLEYTTIEAPSDGTLIARNVERGDVVQPGKALMVLSPAGQTQLVVQIDEKNLSQLHIGQQALASADAFPDQQFAAKVAYINPAVDPQRGSLEVKLDVPQAPDYLRQDMTVSVDIEVARRSNAIAVPLASVHDVGSKTPWVMKVANGKTAKQPVTLGMRGGTQVEIVSGLRAGDLVVAATANALKEGKHVRVNQPLANGASAVAGS
jgi:HlyD family secretion protein